MDITRTTAEDGALLLHVTATAEDVYLALTDGVDTLFAQLGTTPRGKDEDLMAAMIERFGPERAEKAITDAAVNYLLPSVLNAEHIIPACSPTTEEAGVPQAGVPYSFTVRVYPRPEMELSSYDLPEVVVTRTRTDAREIDGQLLALAQYYAETTDDGTPILPAITDAWVAETYPATDINSVQELREQIKHFLDSAKEEELEREKVNAAVAELSQRLVGDLPAAVIAMMKADLISGLEEELIAQGEMLDVALKDQSITREEFENAMEQQARSTLLEGLTMDAVYRHENMELTDEDIEKTIHAIAATASEADRMAAEARLREMGRTPALEEVAKRMKAGEWIREHTTFTVKG